MRKYTFSLQKPLKNILLIVAIIAAFPSAVYAKKPQPLNNLIVVDANGKIIGNVIGAASFEGFLDSSGPTGETLSLSPVIGTVIIALSIDNQSFALQLNKNSFKGNVFGPFFESNTCSGTPFLQANSNSLFPSVSVSSPGNTVYLQEPNATPKPSPINQELCLLQHNGSCTCAVFIIDGGLVPAIPLVDLNTLFTPPFSIRGQ